MLHSANFCQSRVKWTIEHKKHSYWPPLYLPLSSLGEEISPKKVVCQSKIKLWSRMENVARTSERQSRLPLVHLPWHSLPNFASLMISCFALSFPNSEFKQWLHQIGREKSWWYSTGMCKNVASWVAWFRNSDSWLQLAAGHFHTTIFLYWVGQDSIKSPHV